MTSKKLYPPWLHTVWKLYNAILLDGKLYLLLAYNARTVKAFKQLWTNSLPQLQLEQSVLRAQVVVEQPAHGTGLSEKSVLDPTWFQRDAMLFNFYKSQPDSRGEFKALSSVKAHDILWLPSRMK